MKEKREKEKFIRAVFPSFHIEIDKRENGLNLIMQGIKNIEEYGEERIIVKIKEGRVYMLGKALSISMFENRTAEIRGYISEVKFVYDRA